MTSSPPYRLNLKRYILSCLTRSKTESVIINARVRSTDWIFSNLVPRGRDPFGGSRPLARSNSGSPRFTDFPSLCACSESSLTNLIGSGLNQLCLHSFSKPECRWTWPGVACEQAEQAMSFAPTIFSALAPPGAYSQARPGVPIFPAHDKRDPWGRGWDIQLKGAFYYANRPVRDQWEFPSKM